MMSLGMNGGLVIAVHLVSTQFREKSSPLVSDNEEGRGGLNTAHPYLDRLILKDVDIAHV